jgi:hypothetical protein
LTNIFVILITNKDIMKKICKKCGAEFTPGNGLLNFCSQKCTRGREQTPEMLKKKSDKTLAHWKEGGKFRDMNWNDINQNVEKRQKSRTSWFQKAQKRIEKGEQLSTETLKRYLIEVHGHKCWKCEATEWQGEFLHLEIDHMDGNKKNNELSNVQILCPNCHSITPNWRYKNIKRKDVVIKNPNSGRSGYEKSY